MQTAQKEATTPMSAAMLSPSKGLLKSIWVKLKMINPKAITINIVVKTFMK